MINSVLNLLSFGEIVSSSYMKVGTRKSNR